MKSPKPFPLKVGQYVASLLTAMGILGLLLAIADVHIFSIGSSLVGGHQFLAQVGFFYAAVVVCTAAIAIALLRDKAWARPAMLLFWLLCALYAGVDADKGTGIALMGMVQAGGVLIAGVVAAVYLYASRDAATYFRSLRSNADADAAA